MKKRKRLNAYIKKQNAVLLENAKKPLKRLAVVLGAIDTTLALIRLPALIAFAGALLDSWGKVELDGLEGILDWKVITGAILMVDFARLAPVGIFKLLHRNIPLPKWTRFIGPLLAPTPFGGAWIVYRILNPGPSDDLIKRLKLRVRIEFKLEALNKSGKLPARLNNLSPEEFPELAERILDYAIINFPKTYPMLLGNKEYIVGLLRQVDLHEEAQFVFCSSPAVSHNGVSSSPLRKFIFKIISAVIFSFIFTFQDRATVYGVPGDWGRTYSSVNKPKTWGETHGYRYWELVYKQFENLQENLSYQGKSYDLSLEKFRDFYIRTGYPCNVMIAFSPDGKIFASGGSWEKTIQLWDVSTHCLIKTLTISENSVVLEFLSFSPDGKILALGNYDNTVKLLDITTGNFLHILAGHQGRVSAVSFSPDGTMLASGGLDNEIKLWDVSSGNL
ncbi:MAG: WD40 repeat domain-containing protein [Candidatus Omnitrophota bacterium]